MRAALGSSGRLGMKEVVVTCLGTNNRTSCMKERNDRGSWKAKEKRSRGKEKKHEKGAEGQLSTRASHCMDVENRSHAKSWRGLFWAFDVTRLTEPHTGSIGPSR